MTAYRTVWPPEAVRAKLASAPPSAAEPANGAAVPDHASRERFNDIAAYDARVAAGMSPETAAHAARIDPGLTESFAVWAAHVTEKWPDGRPFPGRLSLTRLANAIGMPRKTMTRRIERWQEAQIESQVAQEIDDDRAQHGMPTVEEASADVVAETDIQPKRLPWTLAEVVPMEERERLGETVVDMAVGGVATVDEAADAVLAASGDEDNWTYGHAFVHRSSTNAADQAARLAEVEADLLTANDALSVAEARADCEKERADAACANALRAVALQEAAEAKLARIAAEVLAAQQGGSHAWALGGISAIVVPAEPRFDVILTGFSEGRKIPVINEVRLIAGLGLKEAKDLVESCPSLVRSGLSQSAASDIKRRLVRAGAQVEGMLSDG